MALDRTVRRLLPDCAETTIDDQVATLDYAARQRPDRPYVVTNFALTLDGHATLAGRSGPIGSDSDTAMLVALRTRVDAVMIGAGTMRAERYSGLKTRVIVVESGADGWIDLGEHLRSLRQEGVRALLCEGGPRLHGSLQALGLVDELFLTSAPKLTGGEAPRIIEGELPDVVPLELAWLLEEDGELFARYARRRHADSESTV